jgi:ADP-heptose:LPS heptosyltransferase
VLAVHPGSGSRRKNCPAERLAATIEQVTVALDLVPVLVVGPADAEPATSVLRALAARSEPQPLVVQDLDLFQLAALLGRSTLYVGNDSGVTHLAAAVGARVVAAFGPTDPRRWAPRGPDPTRIRVVAPDQTRDREAAWSEDLRPQVDEFMAAVAQVLREAG